MAAETECRQENIAPGSTDFLLRYCVAVNKELNPFISPKGVYRKGTGTPRKQQAVRPQAAQGRGKGRAEVILTVVYHRQPNMERGLILCRQ